LPHRFFLGHRSWWGKPHPTNSPGSFPLMTTSCASTPCLTAFCATTA
jgi:hypothetical protein